jgi:Beta-carotene isomerase D27-like, C-terminal
MRPSFYLFLLWTSIASALQPAAPKPSVQHTTASTIPSPPPNEDPFQPSPIDSFLLAAFRWTLQQQSGGPQSDRPGFDGMVEELLDFRKIYGLDEQERVSYQTLIALSGPVPFIYRQLFSSADFSPALLAWFAKHLLPFLVGDMEMTARSPDDPRPGGVLVKRCRVLEGTNCKGVCAKMCKIPTQRFFAEEWGVPLSMTPNFETGQCQLAFGNTPLPVKDDPTIPSGCLTRCPAASMLQDDQPQTKRDAQQVSPTDPC